MKSGAYVWIGRNNCSLSWDDIKWNWKQMRKECRDQYSKVTSGTCLTCEKFIHVDLGKHVALYHLDLAQLWRCPVGWCPVWKETSQDCVDHMRRAHDTGRSVKAGNLARWFRLGQSLANSGTA